jgi:uncharacterized 2Fe-2S/4Fe-4S cluster protein (DUF4445 family)
MNNEYVNIRILPYNKEILVEKDKNLLQTLISAGVNIYASCGGRETCGKCKIKILFGEYTTEQSQFISDEEKKQNIVLACKTFPKSDLSIELLNQLDVIEEIQKHSFLQYEFFKENLKEEIEKNFVVSPLIKLCQLDLPKPSIEDNTADVDRITNYISQKEKINVIFDNFKLASNLPDMLRKNAWDVDCLISEKFCVNEENPVYNITYISPKIDKLYAIAVDIGTTTVVVALVDILNLKILGVYSTLNQQIVYGSDVITRIIHSEQNNGLKELNQKVVYTINELIYIATKNAEVQLKDVYTAVVSGNTTMTHFFLNLPAKYIRREPYIPVVNKILPIDASQVGLMINPQGKVYCLPLVASYVGGDIVGGVVACGIDESDDLCVLLDLGTNGEIVVGNKDFLVSSACSCGPAFEGIGITSGMVATFGAIEDIEIKDTEVKYKVIGDTKPVGICGSGLIDIPDELYKAGIIDRAGKFIKDNKIFKNRIRENDNGELEFVIVEKKFTANKQDIVITESDIENILRSKGAIFHGLYTLIKYLGLNLADIKKIYVSGGFGSFIDIKKAQVLGLFPDIEQEKFVISGNTSLLGAILFLLSSEARERIYKVQQKMTYVDLSSLPMYMNEYTSSLFIPHTDLSLFPNITKELRR